MLFVRKEIEKQILHKSYKENLQPDTEDQNIKLN